MRLGEVLKKCKKTEEVLNVHSRLVERLCWNNIGKSIGEITLEQH